MRQYPKLTEFSAKLCVPLRFRRLTVLITTEQQRDAEWRKD
jgi:hypothetical protein